VRGQFGLGIAKKVVSWVLPGIERTCRARVQALYALVLSRPLTDGVRTLRLRKGADWRRAKASVGGGDSLPLRA